MCFCNGRVFPRDRCEQLPALRVIFKLNDLSLLFFTGTRLEEDVAGIQQAFDLRSQGT